MFQKEQSHFTIESSSTLDSTHDKGRKPKVEVRFESKPQVTIGQSRSNLMVEQSASTLSSHHSRDHRRKFEKYKSRKPSDALRSRRVITDYTNEDDDSDKTYSRVFVERYLSKYKWYNRNKENSSDLDINRGWAFYEHITLARYVKNSDEDAGREELLRAEPGIEFDEETSLYSFLKTPATALKEWGLGIALYFGAMRAMSFALLVAGLISLSNFLYFKSSKYYGGEGDPNHQSNVFFTLKGSAICDKSEWRQCEENYCDIGKMKDINMNFVESDGFIFVERILCDGSTMSTGLINLAAILFLVCFTVFYVIYQNKIKVTYDEEWLTASDYSIRIKNPPPDAYDPEEWKSFFSNLIDTDDGIVMCTIILNNDQLIWNLINRRICVNELQKLLPKTDLNTSADLSESVSAHIKKRDNAPATFCDCLFNFTIAPIMRPFNRFLPAERLIEKIEMYSKTIKEMQDNVYEVTDVFLTFDTEDNQRKVLKKLETGWIDIIRNKTEGKDRDNLFRGETVLHVEEPSEPSGIIYQDLPASLLSRVIRGIITFLVTVGLVALSAYLILLVREDQGPYWAGILTSVFNMLIPSIVKLLLLLEKHSTEGGRQRSLYMKVTLFRWLNTVILTRQLSGFSKELSADSDGLLDAVNGIFISEMFFVPVFRLIDFSGNLSKHYFAPRATTQDQMFLCFKGSAYNLAEKYTDLTKIVFLSYAYCALFPMTLFMGAIALTIRYYVEKYCLLRMWRSAPFIGAQLADFSVKYFFTLALALTFYASAFDWAYFRFDRVCDGETDAVSGEYILNEGDPITIGEGTRSVRVCDDGSCCQEKYERFSFLNVPSQVQTNDFSWMSGEQEDVSSIYGWTAFVAVIVFLVVTFGQTVITAVLSLFRGTYSPDGNVQYVDFTSDGTIPGYIPQIALGRIPFPLIFCNIDDIDQNLVGWNDPDRGYDANNIIYDVPHRGIHRVRRIEENTRMSVARVSQHQGYKTIESSESNLSRPIYSLVKQWLSTNQTTIE